jgi:hypothetical protein
LRDGKFNAPALPSFLPPSRYLGFFGSQAVLAGAFIFGDRLHARRNIFRSEAVPDILLYFLRQRAAASTGDANRPSFVFGQSHLHIGFFFAAALLILDKIRNWRRLSIYRLNGDYV